MSIEVRRGSDGSGDGFVIEAVPGAVRVTCWWDGADRFSALVDPVTLREIADQGEGWVQTVYTPAPLSREEAVAVEHVRLRAQMRAGGPPDEH